jgi:chloride channel protein, CIC family
VAGFREVGASTLRAIAERSGRQSAPLLALAVLTGILGAAGNVVFRYAIEGASRLFRGQVATLGFGRAGIPLALVAGGLVLLVFERLFPGEVLGYGFPRFLEMLHLHGARVKRRWAFLKTVGAAVSLGAGASVGREGPIAQIGGSLAATVAWAARLPVGERKVLIACGAAAGIAATFNAPLASILFAQEIVLLGEAQLAHLSLIVVAAATSVATTHAIFGSEPALHAVPFVMQSNWEVLTYAALGVLLGLLAVAYVRLFHATAAWVRRLGWPRPVTLLGGLALVGVLAAAVPRNLADGYPVINEAISGRLMWEAAAVLMAAKIVGSVLSLASGAPGGVFGPILFIGAMTGASFRALSALVAPHLTGPNGSYALVGLGGFLAATTHAPLTAMFLLFEMTEGYSVVVPALMTVGLGLIVAQRLEPESIDTYGLSAEGKQLHGITPHHVLDRVPIGTAYHREVPPVPESCPLPEVSRRLGDSGGSTLPVVDANGDLVGVISFNALRTALVEEVPGALVVAGDLCDTHVPAVNPDTSVAEAFRRIESAGLEEIPVVDPANPRRVLGMLSRADLITVYNHTMATLGGPGLRSWVTARTDWSDRFRVITIDVPPAWLNRSLRSIDCRGAYGVAVLALRRAGEADGSYEIPDPDRDLAPGDILVLAGTAESLRLAQTH